MGIDATMLVKTKEPVSRDSLKNLSWRLVDAFGKGPFFYQHDGKKYGSELPLTIVDEVMQDGPTVHPEPGEVFVQVNLSRRYYGHNYERGPIVDHIAIAEWLEFNIPGCSVWYGGDSSGVCLKHFDAEHRNVIKQHFFEHGHWPYRRPYTGFREKPVDGHRCGLCGSPCVEGCSWAGGCEAVCVLCGCVEVLGDNGNRPRRQWSKQDR